MTSRQLIITLLVLIALGIVVGGIKLALDKTVASPVPSPTETAVACTMDAKMCPDGSYVGRTGPKCEFAACPVASTATSTFTAKINERTGDAHISIVPTDVVEDSRCPMGVMCIQAGTVRVKAAVTDNGSTTIAILGLNKSQVIGTFSVELTGVEPVKAQHTTIKPSDYKFTFTVTK